MKKETDEEFRERLLDRLFVDFKSRTLLYGRPFGVAENVYEAWLKANFSEETLISFSQTEQEAKDQIEKCVKPTQKTPQPKFKVGQEVVALRQFLSLGIGAVVSVLGPSKSNDEYSYYIHFPNHQWLTFEESGLEAYEMDQLKEAMTETPIYIDTPQKAAEVFGGFNPKLNAGKDAFSGVCYNCQGPLTALGARAVWCKKCEGK